MKRTHKIETIEYGKVIAEITSEHINAEIDNLLDSYDYVELGFKSGYATRISIESEVNDDDE